MEFIRANWNKERLSIESKYLRRYDEDGSTLPAGTIYMLDQLWMLLRIQYGI